MRNSKLFACIWILVLGFLTGCQQNQQGSQEQVSSSLDLFAMDTYVNLKVYCEDTATAQAALQAGEVLIQDMEHRFSVTDPDSDVSRINQNAGNFTEISSDTENLIQTALAIGAESNGALDISVYPVLKEWGFTTQEYKIPEEETLRDLLDLVDYTQISLEDHQVRIPEHTQIDLGAVAKGYIGDQLMALFQEYGAESAVISLGGNVQALGAKPDGSAWNVAVVNPLSPSENMGILQIINQAVITSGNYERYFIGEDHQKYWHIIDPSDGFPADNGLVSVTVIGENGLLCDALSTTLFILGTEQAVSYWQESENPFDMILVTETGTILITEDISESFENLSTFPVEVIFHDEAS